MIKSGGLGLGLVILCTLWGGFALAGDEALPLRYGLAMHGAPKYAPDFTHVDYVNPDAPKGGILRQAVTGSFDTLHDRILRGRKAAGLHLTQDSLMARIWDEAFSLYGLIAESYQMPEDRSFITFNLRPEARWHDGTPITAEDVRFTLDTLRDKGRPNARRTYELVQEIEIENPQRITFYFAPEADRELPLIIAMMPLLSKNWWQERDFESPTLDIPLSSGPYRIAAIQPGRQIIYERVQDYWGKDLPVNRGLYNFDQIRFTYFRDDTVALEDFLSGGHDLRRESDVTLWQNGYTGNALREGRILKAEIAHGRPEPVQAIMLNTRRAPLDDPQFRRALLLAFDGEGTNQRLFGGAYHRVQSYYPNSELTASGLPDAAQQSLLEPYRDSLPEAVFGSAWQVPGHGRPVRENLQEAITLLRAEGYGFNNGKLTMAETGAPITLSILLNGSAEERLALALRSSLLRIGVDVQIRIVESAQYIALVDEYDYDLTINRWFSSLSPGNEIPLYWGSAGRSEAATRNYPGIASPAVDGLAGLIADSHSRADLVAATHAMDRVLTHGEYIIPLYYLGRDLIAYQVRLQRPAVTPVYGAVVESWWEGALSNGEGRQETHESGLQ